MTNQPYADDLESDNWEPKESYSTALEHVISILRMISIMSVAMKQDNDLQQDVNQFFMQPWVLEQSEKAYELLYTLLGQTKELAESLSGAEAELACFSFDKVTEILLNNLNALFHSERSYLEIVFKVSSTKPKQGTDWLQDSFYPEVLRMLVWRQFKYNPDDKSFEKKLEYLSDWQKLLPFKNKAVLFSIYEEFAPQNAQTLYDKHKQYFSTLIDFENDVSGILADLQVELKLETNDVFEQTVDKVNVFLMQAIKQKSPSSGLIIQETFKSVLKTEPGKNESVFVYDKIFQNLKSILFLASDNRQSKIAAVVKNLLDQNIEIKLNSSTEFLLKMITADAVNVLKNVAPVQLTRKGKQKKVTVPWKSVIQKQTLAASEGSKSQFMDFSDNLKNFDEEKLPQIVEVGLHITSYVAGISVTYRDGTVFERKGSTPDNMTYESIRLADNEYITSVVGRNACWTDQLEIRTNLGQVLKGGGNGGNEKKLEYIQTACIIGFDMKFHHHLTWLEVHYVDLNEVDNKQQDPIVSLISESDLLAKGIEQSYMNFFSQKAIDEIKTIQALTGKNIVDPALTSSQKQAVVSDKESSTTTMISTSDGPSFSGLQGSALPGEDDLHMHIIHSGSNEEVDDFVQVLQLLLKESREPIRTQFNILQDSGMTVTRACFATIVKLSGLTHKIENLLQAIELHQPDISSDEPKERIKELKEIVKSQGNDVTLILNEWCSATKMRKWLKDECQAQGIDSTNSEPKFQQIIQSVVSKAEFLVKLERPHFYQSLNPNQEIFELSYKIPSYARDDKKDLDEIAETDKSGVTSNVWREHYNSWKTSLKKQGTIRSQQQKLSEIRQIGTSAIIVCLQHYEITSDCLLEIVEANFLNSCYRLAGLHLIELVCSILEKDKAPGKPSKGVMDCIQNVTAALSKGIRVTDSDQCHYLDGIKSCGDHLGEMVRSSFFNIVRSISQYFQYADKNDLKNLYSCLDWSFKARDFESLLNLNVFKLLHTGSSEQVKKTPGESPNENTVLKSWTMQPKGELTKQLQVLSSNLYMAIVSRLAEPEARKIIFDKKDTEATGVSTLSRASSAVCVNTAQALLAQEFNIMFREFNEFVLVSNKLDKYIEFSTLEQYFKADEKAEHLLDKLPQIVSGVIAKILSNAPYENYSASDEEESKQKAVAPEEIKIQITEESNLVPKKKYYSLGQYTQEQIDVLQAVDAGQELTEQQRQIQTQIQEQQDHNALIGLFDEDEYDDEVEAPKVEEESVIGKMLTRNDSDIPKLRQKIMQVYRTYAEDNNITRYLDLVTIFVKIATKAPYPLEMLQNVANPYFIKTLLQMLFQVSVRSKLKILSIFQTLVRIQVPLSIFDESVKDLKVQLRTDTSVKFESSFAKFLFQSALQIQAATWDSAFSEEKRGGMYDVNVQLTKTVALILKIRDQAKKAENCFELSQACNQISKDELTAFEVSTVMQVLQATCAMPIIGDTVLFTKQAQSSSEAATAQQLHWNSHDDLFDLKYSRGCLILPEFVPDSLIPIKLSQEALSSLTEKIKDLSKAMPNEKLENAIQLVFLLKLLLLQNMQSGINGLNSLSSADRQSLVKSLRSIFAFQGSHTAKTGDLYITSYVEFMLALHSRDQIEQILSSGVDPFDSTSQSTLIVEESKQVKKQNTSKGKVNSAAGKYSKELLNKAKKKKAGAKAAAPKNVKQNLMNALFKDVFATVDEIIDMNAQVQEYCQQSGCSLLEALIAINEACSKEKKHFTTESIVEMANERLERLAENQDPSKDSEIEGELVEQITKKIEKIVALYKPDQFKTEVLDNINLSAAIKIIQDGSHGLCNLLTTRVQEKLFENINDLQVYKEQQSFWMKKFETDRSHDGKAKNISNEENKTTLALTLARRFAQKLLTSMFDPSQDICGESEAQDIADVIAGVQPVNLKKCFDSAFKHITDGLGSYADSIQMLNISDGTECAWEVSFTENFKVESNLSSNLDSMRELVDYAITVDKLKIRSRESLASKAQHLLNEKLVSSFQETEELQAQSKEFIHYLFSKLIAKTYDDFLLRQPAISVCTSSLVKNLSKGSEKVCNFELVERVKLIVDAVLKSSDTSILAVNGSQLFDLSIYILIQNDTGADQQRLLLDQAFQIVHKFDSDCMQQDAVAQSTWRMIVRSQVLKQIELSSDSETRNIFNCLFHDLDYLIQSIDKKFTKTLPSANDLESARKKWFKFNKDLKEMQFETQMFNICIDQEKHHKVFERSNTVAINIDKNQMVWQPIELGFVDGAQTLFNLKAKNEEETEKLKGNSFELSYRANAGAQVHSKKIIFGEPIDPITINDQALEVCCVSNSVTTNVKQVGQEDSKFIHTSGAVKYALDSKQGKSLFFVTDLTVYEVQHSTSESEAARSQQLSVPKDLDLKATQIAEIVKYQDGYIFKTTDDKIHLSANLPQDTVPADIKGSNVVKSFLQKDTRAFITSDGQIHSQNLFKKVADEQSLTKVSLSEKVVNFREGDKVVDLQMQGEQPGGYAVLICLRRENKVLLMKGDKENSFYGLKDVQLDQFKPISNQNSGSSFEKVFLFDKIAFTTDSQEQLWILGGKLPIEDNSIFPLDFDQDFFNRPTKSNFTQTARKILTEPETTQIQVKDVKYSEQVILIDASVKSETNAAYQVKISLQVPDNSSEPYVISKVYEPNAFIFEDKLWSISAPSESNDDHHILPQAKLEVIVKPLKYNIDNITPEIISTLDPSCALVEELTQTQKLMKNTTAVRKVYKAMNDFVKSEFGNNLLQYDQITRMLNDASCTEEVKAGEPYNPIKRCWDQSLTQQNGEKLVKAIVAINAKYFEMKGEVSAVFKKVFTDPLLQDSLLRERIDPYADAPSLDFCMRFCTLNEFILQALQDSGFKAAEKPDNSSSERVQIPLHRFKASQMAIEGKVDRGNGDTIFTQVFDAIEAAEKANYQKVFRVDTDYRIWRANFQGEGSYDIGGPYRESMENISRELSSSVLPVLIPTENQRHEHGEMRECFVLNHQATTSSELKQIYHFGLMIGFGIRSGQSWNIALHPIIWKEIVGTPLDPSRDLETSDKFMHQMFEQMRLQAIQTENEEDFQAMLDNQSFTVDFGLGETELVPDGANISVTKANLEQYIRLASLAILRKASVQTRQFMAGVEFIVPRSACRYLSWRNAEIRAMGESTIDIQILRKYTNDESGYDKAYIDMFFEVLEEMSEEDKQKYLKFVNGRAKIAANPAEGRKHKISQGPKRDDYLPQAHTCFFEIDLPRYSSKEIMSKRILTAIRFCGEIDTD